MARTNVKGTQVLDGSIGKVDLNTTVSGSAVITRIIGSNGLAIISSSGADSGTGDVTLAADLSYLNGKYPSLEVSRNQNAVFAGPSSGSGNPTFRALVAGDIPAIGITGVIGLQVALDAKLSGNGAAGYLSKYSGGSSLGNSILYENGGNIGIGTTNTVSRLTFGSFRSNTEETVGINFHQALISGGLPSYGIGMGPAALEGYLTYRAGEGNSSAFGHKFFVNNVEVMRVRGDGNVGIGTTLPAFKLDIAGDARINGGSNLRLYRSNNTTHGLNLSAGASNNLISAVTGGLILTSVASMNFDSATGHFFRDAAGANTFASITSTGDISIGPGIPRTRAHIIGSTNGINGMEAGSATGTSLIISNNNPLYGLHVGVYSNGMTWMQAARTDGTTTTYNISLQAAGGNVGVGNTNPAYKLDVSGSGNFSGNVTLGGNVGVGATPVSHNSLRVNKAISGAITSVGIMNGGAVQSDVTSQAIYNYTQLNTQTAAFTLNNAMLFSVGQGTIGDGSSVANVFGYHVESTMNAGTNNYAFFSGLGAGSGRWNIYMLGTANNYLAGNLWIGTTSSSYKLDVNGNARFSSNLLLQGTISDGNAIAYFDNNNITTNQSFGLLIDAGTSANDYVLRLRNAVASELFRVTGTGNVGINISTPNYKLDVNGTAHFVDNVTFDANAIIGLSPTLGNHAVNKTYADLKLLAPISLPSLGQFLKYTGSNIWASLAIADVSGLQTSLDSKISGSGTPGYLSKYSVSSSLSNSIIYENGGNIGINTTNAISRLTFGSFRTIDTETVGINLHQALTSGGLPAYGIGMGPAATEGYLTFRAGEASSSIFGHKFFVNNVEVFRIRGDGRVGIGTNLPGYLLDVTGTGHFTGNVTLDANAICATSPSIASHLTNKAYVDSLAFIKRGDSVKTISLVNITLSGLQTINSVALAIGDLILVAGQTTSANNGVYVVASGAWSRGTTNDSDLEIRGAYHYITNGTYANQRYINTNASTITVGVTAITYALDFGAETDPVWSAFQVANNIDNTAINNWNIAFNNRISTKNTGDLIEGANLYFTSARVLETPLTDYSVGSNTALASTDKIIDAFKKVQGQINDRLIIGGNTLGSMVTIGTNDNFDFSFRRNNAVQAVFKSGVLEVNFDLDVKGKLKLNGQTGVDHQFIKYNGTNTGWATLNTGELSDKNDIVMLTTISGERGFQLFSDTSKTYAESFLYANPDAGISLGLHGYSLDYSDTIKEFGMQLDTDGYLYHKKLDGSRSRIATIDMINGGSGSWNGGAITDNIYMAINKNIYWDKNSSSSAFIGYNIQTMVVPQQKLFSIQCEDTMGIGCTNDLYIGAGRILLQKNSNPVEFDISNAYDLLGQNVKFIVDTGTGIARVKLVAAEY